MANKGLGRGLGSLLGILDEEVEVEKVKETKKEEIKETKKQTAETKKVINAITPTRIQCCFDSSFIINNSPFNFKY